MTMPEVTGTVRLPVRTRRALSSDGASHVEALVFCPLLRRSLPFDLCAHCTRCAAVALEHDGSIECRIALPRDDGSPRIDVAEAAARACVGEVLSREVACVQADVPAELALELLDAGAPCVPVVSSGGRLLGVIRAATTLCASAGGEREPMAGDLAAPAQGLLSEGTPLSIAIGVLARSSEAALPVVTSAGAVVGVLRPTDVLRWVARRMGYED